MNKRKLLLELRKLKHRMNHRPLRSNLKSSNAIQKAIGTIILQSTSKTNTEKRKKLLYSRMNHSLLVQITKHGLDHTKRISTKKATF